MLLAAVYLYWRRGPEIFAAATIRSFDPHDPSTWYRLVAGLFVHGAHHEFQALIVVSVVMFNGWRVERALGSGALLFAFLAGGIAGNAVRVGMESAALLQASAGTTAGALALIGATASTAVRTRQQSFVPAIFSALGSALLTIIFSAAAQLGANWNHVIPPMLPAAGVAFIVGGFLAAVLPLYEPARWKWLRIALLVFGLAPLGIAGREYVAALPSRSANPPTGRRATADVPVLETTWDSHLSKYDFGLPLSHSKRPLEDTDRGEVVLVPNFVSLPIIQIMSMPRDPRFSADAVAFSEAKAYHDRSPDSKPVDEGPIDDCPLGPAYRQVLEIHEGQVATDLYICVVQGEDDFLLVVMRADPDDLEAPGLARAICRSLKVHSASTDKRSGGHSR